MQDPFITLSKGLSFPQDSDREVPELKDIVKDELVADFYRFVSENDLRLEALEALEKRLGE